MGVEAGERLVGVAFPGRGERPRQVVLLGQQIDGPVAHAARLDEQHLGALRQDVGEQALVVDEPRQPALHAVEQRALGEALPLLTAPRLDGDEAAGALADVVGGDQLAGREDQRLGEVAGRALVVDAEGREAVDLVTPQVDANRGVGRGREDVDDRPATGELAAVLDEVLAAVAELDQLGGEDVGIDRRRRVGP